MLDRQCVAKQRYSLISYNLTTYNLVFMYSLNKAMLLGNLTRDPEVRTTPNGQSVANFGIATNRNWTDQAGVKQSAVEY